MLSVRAELLAELPVDELGLLVLQDMAASEEWNARNYWLGYNQSADYRNTGVPSAIQEAIAWLYNRGLLVRNMGQSAEEAIAISRGGRRALEDGLEQVRAEHSLAEGLHPEIEARARRQFLLGEYEQAVFVSMKAVEVKVRELSELGDELVGVDLMNQAFGQNGVLTDPDEIPGEREGRRALFAGAYAVLRNPAGHREVNYDDVAEAAEAVATASLLMRILDALESV